MSAIDRRLTRLEKQVRPVDPFHDLQRAWLNTLTDGELEDTETALEHLNAGGDLATLPTAVRDRYLSVVESWQRYQQEHAQ